MMNSLILQFDQTFNFRISRIKKNLTQYSFGNHNDNYNFYLGYHPIYSFFIVLKTKFFNSKIFIKLYILILRNVLNYFNKIFELNTYDGSFSKERNNLFFYLKSIFVGGYQISIFTVFKEFISTDYELISKKKK